MKKNLERMIRLAEEFFDVQHDPDQIQFLFYWPFSAEGEKLAEGVASKLHLPLYKKDRTT
jgi:hypothetical protein